MADKHDANWQTFMENLSMVDTSSVLFAIFSGVIWYMANIFLSSAISVAGISVAFPIEGGLGWIGSIVFNFVLIIISSQQYSGNLLLLWGGLGLQCEWIEAFDWMEMLRFRQ